jgi:hypothetical protein
MTMSGPLYLSLIVCYVFPSLAHLIQASEVKAKWKGLVNNYKHWLINMSKFYDKYAFNPYSFETSAKTFHLLGTNEIFASVAYSMSTVLIRVIFSYK